MRQLSGHELVAMHAASVASQASAAPLLLDVREPWEFALAAIQLPGLRTVHIPMGEIPTRLDELDPQRPVVCVCHHGVRSAQVVAFLTQHGFETAYNLRGGIQAWSQQIDPGVAQY